jgi:hypothetical protein
VHSPLQAPPLQTIVQAVPATHLPVASQVSGVMPSHCLVPGMQLPVQPPALQRY